MLHLSFAILVLEGSCVVSIPMYDHFYEALTSRSKDSMLLEDIRDIFPGLTFKRDEGMFVHNGHQLGYIQSSLPGGRTLLLLVFHDASDLNIYQFALDLLDIGVQIYRNDSTLMAINKASEEMSNISRQDVLGKELNSIYDTDEGSSTVLQVLSKRTPVYDKAAQFDVRSGGFVTVLNTSIPYFNGKGDLQAVVNLEYNQNSLERLSTSIQKMQSFVSFKNSADRASSQKQYYCFDDIITRSPVFLDALSLAKKAALQDSNLFIEGETGTGKEMVAQSVYSAAKQHYRSFVAVNCSTIPEELADSILFGSVKGAFTGSVHSDGLFAAADGGILFLDEINSLGMGSQARLLRVLQEGTYMKVGATKEISCNVRVIASSNQSPSALVRAGKFRSDLFYRLTGTVISIPPLRARRDDIMLLADYYLRYYSKKFIKNVSQFSEDTKTVLCQYDWPGNVRELKNAVEFAVNIASGPEITTQDLPNYLRNNLYSVESHFPAQVDIFPPEQYHLDEQVEHYEKELISRCLYQNHYNITQTAAALSISRQVLQYKMKKYQLR